jgi:catechol 2,3-dioxygenase-like lactoylglutathione lyase family enzyme
MSIATESATFDVGGVRLDRPFKVRRLGHLGLNCIKMEECVAFYRDALGFRVSDRLDLSKRAKDPDEIAEIATYGDPGGYFMRHGTDHHSFVLFNKRVRERLNTISRRFAPGVTVNQISWQVGALEEVVNGNLWLQGAGLEIQRTGRDMPGSNWHTYFYDADGHTNELYFGMEQIGWDGHSKPLEMHDRGFHHRPDLPQQGEEDEVRDALARGVDLLSGSALRDEQPRTYDVEGMLLARPFKIIKVGPISLFVNDVAAASAFYADRLGFTPTEEIVWQGERCAFLRANTEHHSVALYPIALRERLGLRADSTTFAVGFQVGTYRQLRAARAFLEARGTRFVELPPELHPGIDYALHGLDPDGHTVQLYFAMEQIGWDGRPRPSSARPNLPYAAWPETISAGDAYGGETLLGPLG